MTRSMSCYYGSTQEFPIHQGDAPENPQLNRSSVVCVETSSLSSGLSWTSVLFSEYKFTIPFVVCIMRTHEEQNFFISCISPQALQEKGGRKRLFAWSSHIVDWSIL